MKLGKISTLAMARMKQRGISLATLRYLLAHGRVERKSDGARLVYLDCDAAVRAGASPYGGRTLYALLDPEGEVITVERRVRRTLRAANVAH
jgi:hypothetical protein